MARGCASRLVRRAVSFSNAVSSALILRACANINANGINNAATRPRTRQGMTGSISFSYSGKGAGFSETGRRIKEFPRQIEMFRQMRGQGLYPEGFRGVMTA